MSSKFGFNVHGIRDSREIGCVQVCSCSVDERQLADDQKLEVSPNRDYFSAV